MIRRRWRSRISRRSATCSISGAVAGSLPCCCWNLVRQRPCAAAIGTTRRWRSPRRQLGLSGEFAKGDVRTTQTDGADTVLLIDVLHYFDRDTQDELLIRAAGLVKPGGRLVLRDADTGRGWRSIVTRTAEGFFTAIRFNRGERVLFRDVAGELVPLLEAQGMSCSVVPCWGGTPFSNVLLVATRATAS